MIYRKIESIMNAKEASWFGMAVVNIARNDPHHKLR